MRNTQNAVLLSTAYLPNAQYFTKILSFDIIYIEHNENYIKQSFRNRCTILSANGPLDLTIPVSRAETDKIPIKELKIDYTQRWQAIHLKAIESAYRNSPFYLYYIDDIVAVYEQKFENLWDFNTQMLKELILLIGVNKHILPTTTFKQPDVQLADFSEVIHPKPKIAKPDNTFRHVTYYQVFESKFGFIPNLSIIDLLFNNGPSTIDLLSQMNVKI